ncbi:hypothetical protein J5N97_008010 [Dioscorea zingiberensis]|uniref:cysteine dioxygenase n=1 Tax=Dioscorea zingiberensis TaxID=325984 RepID=A0A9D5DDS0_9LILI|nr:hypothetical protein J5N97_008010 [Dioscorea zingiberensis]
MYVCTLNDRGLCVRLAKLHTDTVLSAPCPTTVLYPKTGGNLHCFTAVTPCAVLDVLAPPYSEAAGRICTYYHDYPYSTFSTEKRPDVDENEDDYAWLQAIESPDDLYMRRANAPVLLYRKSIAFQAHAQ